MEVQERPQVTQARPSFALRPYQAECLDAIYQRESEGIRRPLVSLPTGTGKTVIFAHLLAQRQGRSLVLAHRDELIRQAVDKLRMVDPSLDIGVVKAEENEVNAHVVVASVQTLSRVSRLALLPSGFTTVIVDEAHHATAETYQRILEHVGAFEPDGPLTAGFTATPMRGDGAGLGSVWQEIVYQKPMVEMILAGYLADLRAVRVKIRLDLDKIHTRRGDFIDSELEAALEAANAPAHVVTAYRTHAAGRKALVFTPGVKSAHDMAEVFRSVGIAAEPLDGNTLPQERKAVLARLHSGETKVVTNCAVLTEGFDEPTVDCIIIARPTKSRPLYIQMIGRGTRTYPGKADCLVLDVVGATRKHSIMAASELFDLDLSNKMSVREAVEAGEREAAGLDATKGPRVDGELVASAVNLFQSRSLHWQRTQAGAWVLSLGNGFLRLVPQANDRWDVLQVVGQDSRSLGDGLPLDYAMGVAEDFARKEGALALRDPDAPWRGQPATEKQLNVLEKCRVTARPGLTKGEASDLIATILGDR